MKKFVGMLVLLGFGSLGFALETGAVDLHFSNADLHGTYVVKFQGTNSGGDGALEGKSLAPVNVGAKSRVRWGVYTYRFIET